MQNSRLWILLQSFTSKEHRELSRFVQSPYFNLQEDIILFHKYLQDCLILYHIIPDKQQAYRHLYGDKAYDDHRIRVLMSALLKLAEKFLVLQDFLTDELHWKTRLLGIYRRRQLRPHFEFAAKDVAKIQEESVLRNATYFEYQFEIAFETYQFQATRQRIGELNLQNITSNLDIAYISQKLRQVCLALSHQAVYRAEYQFDLLKEILVYIVEKNMVHIPAIGIYYHAYEMLTLRVAESFTKFKNVLLTQASIFSHEERRDLFLLAINFCMRHYNEGNSTFLKDLLALYEEGLQKHYFFINGSLSRFTYRNIVTLGLILKEYNWVEKFILDYRSKLSVDYQESMYSFCLARLEYSRKNYDKALQLLQQSEYEDLLLNLSAKTVLLKIFYELDEFDLLESHLQAMHTFMRRKKLMGYHYENYHNLLSFAKKLLEIKPYDEKVKITLKENIIQSKAVAERAWLLEQLEKA